MALPLERSVLWRPAGIVTDPLAADYPLFVTQRLLADLVAAGASARGAFGFLIGELCEDEKRGRKYVVASNQLRLLQLFHGDHTAPPVAAGWKALQAELARVSGRLIGWCHSHTDLPTAPSDGDLATHEKYFGEPWQVMLILGREGGTIQGRWFRPPAPDHGGVALPFFELHDAVAAGGEKPTEMRWTGYTTDDPAVAAPTPLAPEPAESNTLGTHFIHPGAFTPDPDDDDDEDAPAAPRRPPPPPRVTGEMLWEATGAWGKWGRSAAIAGAALMLLLMLYGLYSFALGGRRQRPVVYVAPPAAAPAVNPQRAELETAMRGFTDATRLFQAGQATCDVLARALIHVEESWLAYNTSRRAAAGSSGNVAAAAGDDQSLYSAVDSVENRFEQSSCPRP